MKFFNLGFAGREKWCFDQLLKLWFGLPSSRRSPMRFTLKRKMGVFVELALSEVFDFGFVWW
jgi:hypothetical protein